MLMLDWSKMVRVWLWYDGEKEVVVAWRWISGGGFIVLVELLEKVVYEGGVKK